jgi:hypothetical protein
MTSADASIELAVRRLIAAGGPHEWPANAAWPLHQTLIEFRAELGVDVDPTPQAGLGHSVPGVESAVMELGRLGILELRDEGFLSWWTVDPRAMPALRRELMRSDPKMTQRNYLAARRWAALAATSAKNLRNAAESSTSTSRSGTVRLHAVAPTRR